MQLSAKLSMADYPHKKTAWKKQEVAKKWHTIIGIFVTVVLILAVLNGIIKTLSIGKYFGKSTWDGRGAFSAVVNTKPVSIFVYNPIAREIVLVRLDDNLYAQTLDPEKPLARIADFGSNGNGQGLMQITTLAARSPVKSYVILKEQGSSDRAHLESYFKGFASIFSPVKIMTSQLAGVSDTNITRMDMIRLWWQTKSLSINNLNFIDAAGYTQEIILTGGEKVLGVDDVSLHRIMSEHLENRTILEEGRQILVENSSGAVDKGLLAADIVGAVGGQVAGLEHKDNVVPETFIGVSRDSYTASYLAKIFDCDIKTLPDSGERELKVVVGADFGQK